MSFYYPPVEYFVTLHRERSDPSLLWAFPLILSITFPSLHLLSVLLPLATVIHLAVSKLIRLLFYVVDLVLKNTDNAIEISHTSQVHQAR